MKVTIHMPDHSTTEESLKFGSIKRIPLEEGQKAEVDVLPLQGGDVGQGPGKKKAATVEGGVVGIILDARGRPLCLPQNEAERKQSLLEWFQALDAYPEKSCTLCGG